MAEHNTHIEEVLKRNTEDIAFEPIPDENSSPLVQPVVSKNNTAETVKQELQPPPSLQAQMNPQGHAQAPKPEEQKRPTTQGPLDAPEQEINEQAKEPLSNPSAKNPENGDFTVPLSHATMLADSLLGMTNNILEVGGGYFVTISKEKDFFDFDELIQVIDEQNAKNIKRIKLDEEDKEMLRPLLIVVLRKQSKVLTPEQQLIGVCITILVKKARVVMEIRAENENLVDRITDIIKREMAQYKGANSSSNGETFTNGEKEQEANTQDALRNEGEDPEAGQEVTSADTYQTAID